MHDMKTVLLVAMLISLSIVACRKKADTAGSPTTNAASAPPPAAAAQPLPPPPRHIEAAAQNVPQPSAAGEVNPFLTEQLRIFVQQYRRLPTSFTELATKRLDSIPGPPPGTKWVIDSSTMQVKAVKSQ